MQELISLNLSPKDAANDQNILKAIGSKLGKKEGKITGFSILKKSIDARGKSPTINLSLIAFIGESFIPQKPPEFDFKNISGSNKKVLIIGSGPAGLFSALQLIQLGIKPIILERGKDVRERRRDLAQLNKKGIINPESNYCFGEGGAGTYSDGKLYTRSTKRGDVMRILNLFVHFGADNNVLYEAHPHIGTNKLPSIITNMRNRIIDCGGSILFNKKVVDFIVKNNQVAGVNTYDGDIIEGNALILATGHSARDMFELLYKKEIGIMAKPFALGVRVEHSQELINSIQYGEMCTNLPPASYNLVKQIENRGVFSFCMCPGGIIAPASTENGELVVNGWSPSKHNNPFANSGLVVQIELEDVWRYYQKKGKTYERENSPLPLMMMHFQKEIEEKAFYYGGGKFVAPAQRMVDFVDNVISANLPKCSYPPGVHSASLTDVLPSFISKRLKTALPAFGKKLVTSGAKKSYFTNEAILVATESRTSSPVRIPRDSELLNHPQISNLFPCGEGAGYAGGIVSAAMDGERVAKAVHHLLQR